MVRGHLLQAILSQRTQKVQKELGIKEEVDENDSQRESIQNCGAKEEI